MQHNTYRPELLLPSGSLRHMRYAFAYGADAVYAGLPRYSLRVRNNDFNLENLRIGIEEAHKLGKKFFVTVNIMPHNAKLKTFLADMAKVVELKPDALIMADPGLIDMVRSEFPDMPIHLSVQANTVNWATVKFWEKIGVERIILSRELSLEEVEEIRENAPNMELEVFVHGALCIAYSGRCLLSGYFNHRDPNQGTCTNSCRWDYDVHEAVEDEGEGIKLKNPLPAKVQAGNYTELSGIGVEKRHPKADEVFLVEEANRPGELMPIEEDDHGTYIMNSKDLRAIEHVQALIDMKIDCLKIEGRTKSHYYVARTAQTYRQAIEDALAGKSFDPSLIGTLDNLANRGYTDGFFKRHHSQDYQNYIESHSAQRQQQFCAEIIDWDAEKKVAKVFSKNKMRVGDSIEVILPEGNYDIEIEWIENAKNQRVDEIAGGGMEAFIPLPRASLPFGLISRNLKSGEVIKT
jgi:putative protease